MKDLRRFFTECSHGTLTWIAVGVTVFMIGGGTFIIGFIWVFWRLLDAVHLPTMTLFRAAAWVFYWPGLAMSRHTGSPDELQLVMYSVVGWLVSSVLVLNAAKVIFGRPEA